MNCPRCASRLTEQGVADGSRQLCAACGGFWIDPEPLAKALQKRGVVLPEAGGVAGDLRCPRDAAWLAGFSFQGIELDRCTQCGGLWLDKGEWDRLVAASGKGNVRAMAAGVVGAAVVGGAMASVAAPQPQQPQESGSVAGELVSEVAGGLFECLFDMVTSIDL